MKESFCWLALYSVYLINWLIPLRSSKRAMIHNPFPSPVNTFIIPILSLPFWLYSIADALYLPSLLFHRNICIYLARILFSRKWWTCLSHCKTHHYSWIISVGFLIRLIVSLFSALVCPFRYGVCDKLIDCYPNCIISLSRRIYIRINWYVIDWLPSRNAHSVLHSFSRMVLRSSSVPGRNEGNIWGLRN